MTTESRTEATPRELEFLRAVQSLEVKGRGVSIEKLAALMGDSCREVRRMQAVCSKIGLLHVNGHRLAETTAAGRRAIGG